MESTELVFDITGRMTETDEYGASIRAILEGKAAPPPAGARFDGKVEGTVDGPKLKGSFHSVDYINIRADGRIELHGHARLDLKDGGKVSLFADGLGSLDSNGILQLRETVTLRSNSPAQAWVNSIQVWATGTANLANGEIRLRGYKA